LGNLDAPLRLEMRRELHLLQRSLRATMVYVTHDQEEALTLGDRVAVLGAGRLQQVGRPEEVYARPPTAFVAGVLGWAPIALLDGALVGEAGRLTFVGGGAVLSVPDPVAPGWEKFAGRELTLGLRAEHVALGPGEGGVMLDMEVE